MGRGSSKVNKNLYHSIREDELGLTREKASELLDGITAERIERIENEKVNPYPEEVMIMAEKYKSPQLINYYCSQQCPIGKKHIPEIKLKDLSQIVLGMLSSLNSMNAKKDKLIDITADGNIEDEELETFYEIQNEVDKISNLTNTLKLWTDNMISTGKINKEKLNKLKNIK